MTAILIYVISQANSTSWGLTRTFVVAEIAMIAFAIFISFHFENENRPLMQVWRLQNANAGLAVPAPNQAPQANAGAAGQVNAGAQAGQAGGA